METKKRRSYTQEFREEAVKLVTEQGYSLAEAGRSLGVHANVLGRWKRSIQGSGSGSGGTASIRAELQQLRKKNKRLKMERDILKKATAFFAKELG